MARVLEVSARTVKFLAALVWHVGFLALLWKGARLLHAADALDPGRIWPWAAAAAALVIGSLKARFLLLPAARKNIARIDALEHPRPWNLYTPGFLVFLSANILLARLLFSWSQGDYTLSILSAVLALSIGVALFGSSFVWWRPAARAADPVESSVTER